MGNNQTMVPFEGKHTRGCLNKTSRINHPQLGFLLGNPLPVQSMSHSLPIAPIIFFFTFGFLATPMVSFKGIPRFIPSFPTEHQQVLLSRVALTLQVKLSLIVPMRDGPGHGQAVANLASTRHLSVWVQGRRGASPGSVRGGGGMVSDSRRNMDAFWEPKENHPYYSDVCLNLSHPTLDSVPRVTEVRLGDGNKRKRGCFRVDTLDQLWK